MMTEKHGVLEREEEVAVHDMAGPQAVVEAERLTATEPVVEVRRRSRRDGYFWGVMRLFVGWIFAWPFLDKVFGLGYATESGSGWVDGGSPTLGFLSFATRGPLAGAYQEIAGNAFVDWVFMLGLAGVGLTLMLGVMVRIGALTGALLLLLMYSAVVLPANNPFLDDHLIYAFIMVGLFFTGAGRYLGLGHWWMDTRLVRRFRFLE